MGVVQGRPRGSLVHRLFQPTSVDAIRPISPDIGGLRIAPQLFADDGTLIKGNQRAHD